MCHFCCKEMNEIDNLMKARWQITPRNGAESKLNKNIRNKYKHTKTEQPNEKSAILKICRI